MPSKRESTLEVELAGSGTAGSAAPYGPLLRACAHAEVLNASAVVGTAQAGGSSTTIKLAAGASAVDGAYVGMPISITAGTGNGQKGSIVAYNGTTKIATVAAPWGATPDATSQYNIAPCAVYRPISTGFESATLWVQLQADTSVNSPTHKITGCRGSVEYGFTAKGIPVLKFNFTGLYNAPSDVAQIAAIYSAFKTPIPVNKQNTPVFALNGYSAPCSELSVNAGNEVVYRNLIGSESVLITNREAKGSATFEAPTIAQADFFAAAISTSFVSLILTHGTVAGNIVDVGSASANVLNPSYGESDGIVMMTVPFELVAQTGGDEVFLTVR